MMKYLDHYLILSKIATVFVPIQYSLNVDDSSELTLTKQKETDLEKKLRKTTENNESHSVNISY